MRVCSRDDIEHEETSKYALYAICDFFELLAIQVERGGIPIELAWEIFGDKAVLYWQMGCGNLVAGIQSAENNAALWENYDALERRFEQIDLRRDELKAKLMGKVPDKKADVPAYPSKDPDADRVLREKLKEEMGSEEELALRVASPLSRMLASLRVGRSHSKRK